MTDRAKVLIIGGNGFVGGHIISSILTTAKYDPYSIDLQKNNVLPPTKSMKADITDYSSLSQIFKSTSFYAVIHTASPHQGVPKEILHKVNVLGTQNVIDVCREFNVEKLIFTSSSSVVYDGHHLLNATEDIPYCKVHMDPYNETKALAEDLVLKANGNGLLTIALRPAGIFGPGDMQGVYAVYDAYKSGKHKFYLGQNSTLFDMTYVENVSYAHILCLDALTTETSGQAYNITNDEPVFFFDYAKKIYESLLPPSKKGESLSFSIPFTLAFPLARVSEFFSSIFGFKSTFTVFRITLLSTNRVFSVEKAKTMLGYQPIVSLNEGLERTCNWLMKLRDQEVLDGKY